MSIVWYRWHRSDVTYIFTMGFTVEDRYLSLPTWRMLKVLQLTKKKATDSQWQSTRDLQRIANFNQLDYQYYDLQPKCTLVRCGCPLFGGRLTVPALSIFSTVLSPLTLCVYQKTAYSSV